ncbi:MAG: hypothetical protein JST54_17445 [Deltaproteobacteria bacterium]|nr:hypothetical protein [Deltaproteobacteria bacterium]
MGLLLACGGLSELKFAPIWEQIVVLGMIVLVTCWPLWLFLGFMAIVFAASREPGTASKLPAHPRPEFGLFTVGDNLVARWPGFELGVDADTLWVKRLFRRRLSFDVDSLLRFEAKTTGARSMTRYSLFAVTRSGQRVRCSPKLERRESLTALHDAITGELGMA